MIYTVNTIRAFLEIWAQVQQATALPATCRKEADLPEILQNVSDSGTIGMPEDQAPTRCLGLDAEQLQLLA